MTRGPRHRYRGVNDLGAEGEKDHASGNGEEAGQNVKDAFTN